MSKEKRYLIATADERTWKFDRPVVFLGEWCRLYDRKHVWESMDAVVAEPYGLGSVNKDADHAEARHFEEKIFPLLCGVLNDYHKVDHSQRFWKILIGHWLRRYVNVMLNRVNTLKQCVRQFHITGITAYENNHYKMATLDSYSSIWAFDDDRWNIELNLRILKLSGLLNFPIDYIQGYSSPGFRFDRLVRISNYKEITLNYIYKKVSKLLSYFVRDEDAFILHSYLPVKQSIKLQISLGQIPQLWRSIKFKINEQPDSLLRHELSKLLISFIDNEKSDIFAAMLFELMPVCYLEGFSGLTKLANQQPWPKNPKFIFTSNSFDTDEVFKVWTAAQAESGKKYFVGQHGNNYGTSRYMCPSIEEITADKFLTWGWVDGLPQHTPGFILKTAGNKLGRYNPSGGLLLIEVYLNHRMTTWDSNTEFINYFNEQKIFVENLADEPKRELIIRMHSGYKYQRWGEVERWREFDSNLEIETGIVGINNLIAQSRLVVHSYDSTGILETLSQNIPTLAFWPNELSHLRDSAKPYYQLLLDAGILHLKSNLVAEKINDIWEDVDSWWASKEVQCARTSFCNYYAKISENPTQEFINLLSEKS